MILSEPFIVIYIPLKIILTQQLFTRFWIICYYNIPQISTDQANILDAPLTLSELHNALTHIPNNEAPGPDEFPAEFLKHF